MTHLRLIAIAALLAASLVFAGCQQQDAVQVNPQEGAEPSVEATDDVEPGSGAAVEITVDEGEVTQFVAGAQQAGVFEAMAGLGPYTVLAPTDEAFDALGQQRVDELLQRENRDELARLLSYHVIPGQWNREDFAAVDSVPTISGLFIPVESTGESITVGGVELVGDAQETGSNFVYTIGTVLDPETGSSSPNPARTGTSPSTTTTP